MKYVVFKVISTLSKTSVLGVPVYFLISLHFALYLYTRKPHQVFHLVFKIETILYVGIIFIYNVRKMFFKNLEQFSGGE